MVTKILEKMLILLNFFLILAVLPSTQAATQNGMIKDFDDLLQGLVDPETGLFDGIGSLDAAVWSLNQNKIEPLFIKSYGKSQIKNVSLELKQLQTAKPSMRLKEIADKYMPRIQNVDAKNAGTPGRNQYRIASISKTFIGLTANLLMERHGLDLDEKVSPSYINLTILGMAHNWNNPSTASGYISGFPNSSQYINKITFRHLLTHTSGLSRESKKGDQYSYGSSRTSTPRCPPVDAYRGKLSCSDDRDNNWRPWIQHVVPYMMPACGYSKYNEASKLTSCLPGQYYHYSNAAYSILGFALDSFIRQKVNKSMTLEGWVAENVIQAFKLNDTVFTWIDFDQEQKERTTHGCYGGKEYGSCDQKRALTDYGDRGIKTPPGGIWSTTTDLAKYLLSVNQIGSKAVTNIINGDPKITNPSFDDKSEEDPSHMPLQQFKYGHGWYIAANYSCLQTNEHQEHFIGAWGTVPGFTSYAITNPRGSTNGIQYAVVLVRSYNYNGRLNLGNQARRLLWRLLNQQYDKKSLACPVKVFDNFPQGDKLIDQDKPSHSVIITSSSLILFLMTVLFFIL